MFVGTFVLFALFAVLAQWMLNSGGREILDEEATRAEQRREILQKVDEEDAKLTVGYAWVDRAKGTVRIPIEHAMQIAVQRLAAQGEPRPAYPLDPNVPLGSAIKPGGFAAAQPTPPPFNLPPPAPAPVASTESSGVTATPEPTGATNANGAPEATSTPDQP